MPRLSLKRVVAIATVWPSISCLFCIPRAIVSHLVPRRSCRGHAHQLPIRYLFFVFCCRRLCFAFVLRHAASMAPALSLLPDASPVPQASRCPCFLLPLPSSCGQNTEISLQYECTYPRGGVCITDIDTTDSYNGQRKRGSRLLTRPSRTPNRESPLPRTCTPNGCVPRWGWLVVVCATTSPRENAPAGARPPPPEVHQPGDERRDLVPAHTCGGAPRAARAARQPPLSPVPPWPAAPHDTRRTAPRAGRRTWCPSVHVRRPARAAGGSWC